MEPLSGEAEGCTVGVINIPGGILFFKNRDLAREYLVNRITVFQSTPEVHTLKGTDLKTGELAGVSIGVNRHKICVANTHVVSTTDVTYDVLCERLVNGAQEQQDVPRIVTGFMECNAVQGGRILVASPEWAYLVEVFRREFRIEEVEPSFVITNTFSLLSHQVGQSEARQRSSAIRLEVARRMIAHVSNTGTLKSVLRSHVPEKGDFSICNHRPKGGGTESSHIIEIQGDAIRWSSLIGYPCENDYHTVQLFQSWATLLR